VFHHNLVMISSQRNVLSSPHKPVVLKRAAGGGPQGKILSFLLEN